jgi:hypothetical protein
LEIEQGKALGREHCYEQRNEVKMELYCLLRNVDIVTCIHIARQRIGEHIPEETNARNNRTSIARQRISKHVSLTMVIKKSSAA